MTAPAILDPCCGSRMFWFDRQHPTQGRREGNIWFIHADLLAATLDLPWERIAQVFASPPCTSVAVSGARWFKEKGLEAIILALKKFKVAKDVALKADCPYMIENPVTTVSTYWRKPDHIFHPHQYTGLCAEDNYTKKTCLWTGGGICHARSLPCSVTRQA